MISAVLPDCQIRCNLIVIRRTDHTRIGGQRSTRLFRIIYPPFVVVFRPSERPSDGSARIGREESFAGGKRDYTGSMFEASVKQRARRGRLLFVPNEKSSYSVFRLCGYGNGEQLQFALTPARITIVPPTPPLARNTTPVHRVEIYSYFQERSGGVPRNYFLREHFSRVNFALEPFFPFHFAFSNLLIQSSLLPLRTALSSPPCILSQRIEKNCTLKITPRRIIFARNEQPLTAETIDPSVRSRRRQREREEMDDDDDRATIVDRGKPVLVEFSRTKNSRRSLLEVIRKTGEARLSLT